MVVVPPGSFTMGSPLSEVSRGSDENPLHGVTIAYPLAVGAFPVTRREYAAFVRDTGHQGRACEHLDGERFEPRPGVTWRNPFPQTPTDPVACVNWDDAHAYARWLSAKTGGRYRLPSEAEWEYFARAGSQGAHNWEGSVAQQCRWANAADRSAKGKRPQLAAVAPCDDGFAETSPVGRFTSNAFGLFDVLGDVLQWTEDCYQATYDGAPTDGAPRKGCAGPMSDQKVIRGEGLDGPPLYLRLASRDVERPWRRADDFGFRVVREAP